VNRPFNAFGVLLSLLAVTMFAVSSTSRSTTIKPASERTNRASNRRPAGYPQFEAAVAADHALRSTSERATHPRSSSDAGIETGHDEVQCVPRHDDGQCLPGLSGKDKSTFVETKVEFTEVAPEVVAPEAVVEVIEVAKQTSRLAPVRVAEAEGGRCCEEREPMDCRSYCDAIYDFVVLGWSQPVTPIGADDEIESARPMTDAEITSLFKSVIETTETARLEKTEKRALHSVKPVNPTAGMLPALQKWVMQYVERMNEPVQQNVTPEWSDYAEMIESAILRQSISADVAGSFGGE
jgi:hypothetical protein